MSNHTTTPPMGNTPLPLAVVRQWMDANDENTPAAWAYVAGLITGVLLYRKDITEELCFLFAVAIQRGNMAGREVQS